MEDRLITFGYIVAGIETAFIVFMVWKIYQEKK